MFDFFGRCQVQWLAMLGKLLMSNIDRATEQSDIKPQFIILTYGDVVLIHKFRKSLPEMTCVTNLTLLFNLHKNNDFGNQKTEILIYQFPQ